ncbi:MAG TPA: CBS domain-containing protein, partial [Blastococcus sp.]
YAAEVMAGRGFAALPVIDADSQLVGIVAEADLLRDRLPADPRLHARRDLLRVLGRPDAEIRTDLLRLVEGYTGDLGAWDVTVTEGVATIRRTRGMQQVTADVEEQALRELAATVGGVVQVRVLADPISTERPADASTRAGKSTT